MEVFIQCFHNAKILGLTATPQRMDGTNVLEDFCGEVACEMRLGDAIVNKILPTPTYISALYTFDEEIQRVYEKIDESKNPDEEKEDLRKQLEAAKRQLEIALGVPSILAKHINNNGKYLVFCQNIQHLNTMKPIVMNWVERVGFETHMYEVHTKNPDREAEYKAFTEDNAECVRLCICVDMFNEGVHLEGISGVILLRPTQSSILYLQQIGRALNAGGTQPIIFDLVNNGNCLGAASIRSEIEGAIEKQKAESDRFCDNDNDVFDIGCFHVFDYVRDSLDVLRGIENRCFDDWDYHFQQFLEYKDKYGHGCVMKKEAEEWEDLYEWARTQRTFKNQNKLSKYRIDVLNQHEFVWGLEQWKFDNLIKHIRQYFKDGNILPVPKRYKCQDGYNLGSQITIYKKKKKLGTINQEREQQLVELGIDLSTIDWEDQWIKNYNATYEWICILGKKINSNSRYKGCNIGSWIRTNRQAYYKELLPVDRIEKLNMLDIKLLRGRKKQRWEDFISLLIECKENNIKIATKTNYKDEPIGIRLTYYKKQYRQGKLSEERYQQLLSLGIDLTKKRQFHGRP